MSEYRVKFTYDKEVNAYTNDKPGDCSGVYVQATDYEELRADVERLRGENVRLKIKMACKGCEHESYCGEDNFDRCDLWKQEGTGDEPT